MYLEFAARGLAVLATLFTVVLAGDGPSQCRFVSTVSGLSFTAIPSSCSTTVTSTVMQSLTLASSITATSTVTTTVTDTTSTDTATETDTVTNTETDTVTITTAVTNKDTVIVQGTDTTTITVPTSSGFLPVQSTFPEPSYDSSKQDTTEGKKRELPAAAQGHVDIIRRYGGECSTATLTTTIITGSASLITTTSTTTVTTTTTPLALTTVTTTITTDTTSIETDTATTTVTITTTTTQTPTATFYQACATDNFANLITGDAITGYDNFNYGVMTNPPYQSSLKSAYDCCVASLTSLAEGWYFETGKIICRFGIDSRQQGTCPGNPQSDESNPDGNSWPGNLHVDSTGTALSQYIVGNTYCGYAIAGFQYQ